MSSATKSTNPLPLSDMLRDLALLRASDVDLSPCLPKDGSTEPASGTNSPVDQSVARSYEFVREARAAIKLLDRGNVDVQGSRVEDQRSKLEEMMNGLEDATA